MTPTQQAALATELRTDPLARGYAALLNPYNEAALLALLNTQSYTRIASTNVTAKTVLAAFGAAGATMLDKLNAAAGANSAVKWAMQFMTGAGIDAGDPVTQGLLDQLATAGALTTAEAASLKGLASVPASRGEVLGLGQISREDLCSTVYTAAGVKVI